MGSSWTSAWSRPGDWTGPGGAAAILRRDGCGRRGPRDGARRPRPARHGLRVQRGERVHQRRPRTTSISRASTRSPSSRRSRRRCAASRSPTGWSCSTPTTRSWRRSRAASTARVAYFSMDPDVLDAPRAPPAGGRARLRCCDRGRLVEWDGADEHALLDVADLPVALGGLARHNVANALAAAGGARALGATREQVADGPARLPPVGRPVAGPAQPVPARPADGHRGLRPQRGRHGGDPRRRRRRSPAGGGTDRARDRDHRDRRRPSGRHAARDRADRGGAGRSGSCSRRRRLPARA